MRPEWFPLTSKVFVFLVIVTFYFTISSFVIRCRELHMPLEIVKNKNILLRKRNNVLHYCTNREKLLCREVSPHFSFLSSLSPSNNAEITGLASSPRKLHSRAPLPCEFSIRSGSGAHRKQQNSPPFHFLFHKGALRKLLRRNTSAAVYCDSCFLLL